MVNLLLPFFLLLPKSNKKNEKLMMFISVILLIGHWLDIYILIMPSFMKTGPDIGVYETVMFVGFLSIFLLLFDRAFRRQPEMPKNDPYLVESIHHHS